MFVVEALVMVAFEVLKLVVLVVDALVVLAFTVCVLSVVLI